MNSPVDGRHVTLSDFDPIALALAAERKAIADFVRRHRLEFTDRSGLVHILGLDGLANAIEARTAAQLADRYRVPPALAEVAVSRRAVHQRCAELADRAPDPSKAFAAAVNTLARPTAPSTIAKRLPQPRGPAWEPPVPKLPPLEAFLK